MTFCDSSDMKTHEEETTAGSLSGSRGSCISVHTLWWRITFWQRRLWLGSTCQSTGDRTRSIWRGPPPSLIRSCVQSRRPLPPQDHWQQEKKITWINREAGSHLSDDITAVQRLTWRPGELGPSAQALPWKHTSWLRTCCYSSCKLQQKPDEEMWGIMWNEVLTLFKITDNINKIIQSLFKIENKGAGLFLPGNQ